MSLFDEDMSLEDWDDDGLGDGDYEYDDDSDLHYSYSLPIGLDERFEEAARMVVLTQNGGTSNLQRRLGMGYARAGRVIDQLESAGIVGPQNGSRPRQVLVSDLGQLEVLIERARKNEFSNYSRSPFRDDYSVPAEDKSREFVDIRDIDPRFEEAARLIVSLQRASTSDLQRRLGMGYAKAGRVMDQMEAAGIVSPQERSRPRQVLIRDFHELDIILGLYLPDYQEGSVLSPQSVLDETYRKTESSPLKPLENDYGQTPVIRTNNTQDSNKGFSEQPDECSDSVKATNGCLVAFGEAISYFFIILLLLLLAPVIILGLLIWWIIAWILGLMFPGKEFFPIIKVWGSVNGWAKQNMGIDLGAAALGAGIVLLITALFGGSSSKSD